LIFDLLTLKVVSESSVTWATYVPILVFLGLSVLELGPMYATDRQTDVRQKHRLMPLPYGGGGITRQLYIQHERRARNRCSIMQTDPYIHTYIHT